MYGLQHGLTYHFITFCWFSYHSVPVIDFARFERSDIFSEVLVVLRPHDLEARRQVSFWMSCLK
jgi:hypothetical protein